MENPCCPEKSKVKEEKSCPEKSKIKEEKPCPEKCKAKEEKSSCPEKPKCTANQINVQVVQLVNAKDHNTKPSKINHNHHGVKPCKSRELVGSVLYTDCDCYKRNGLQDSCPRKGCGGT